MLGKFAGGAAKLTVTGMVAAGTAIAGAAAASVNVGKAFESQMSTVAAISGATGEEFAALEAKAKEMGATTQFSATEAGQAMEYMAMAGWKSSDMVGGIAGIMNLAAASGEDLASTSDIVTDALTAFGMTASDSGRFADVLAAASSNANTNVSMLGESFKYVAPLAGTLGYSAEDTSIALGLMANAGIKGSQAGTSLKTALARMSAPTAQQAAAMQKLGLSLTDSEGNMKSMREVMTDMRSNFAGLSEAEQTAAASTIFGKEAMSGMLAIINASEADFNKLTAAIDNSSGAAAEMAAIRLDNLEGDITLLKSGLEGLEIEIYQGMNAPMREAAQTATQYVAQLNAAFQEGGFSGMAEAIGDIASDALLKIADHAPEFIDMAATLIDGFITGIDNNSSKTGASMGRLITTLGSAIIRLSPRLIATGGNLLVQIARGVIENLPQLGAAAKEAVAYLMNAARDALAGYVDFLGDDTVKPFEKFIALIPAVAAGFAAFGGISSISKKISGFMESIKKAGKTVPGFTQASSEMSAAAKNIAAVGAGLALAAAGIWLLADAAIRISSAGPVAQIGLAAMAVGVGALMVIASKMGPELSSAKNGLIAFGEAVLMISAGMSLMAYAATQLAAAGPMALAGLVVMEGGMIAMMVIADTFGKKLTNAAPGLLAFGAAILMAAAGMSLMAVAAAQLGAAGTGAVVVLGIMTTGLAGFMAIAAAMGPQLTAASVGLIAFGAGIALAAAGMYIMAQAAIQLGAAGAPAQIAMALLAVGILAFGAAAGALAPLLLAGAAALAAFGAALAVVSAAAMLGGAALLIISAALPALSEYGASGALAILELGAAMTVFAGGAALAGAGAAAAGLGFGALALAAAAADLAFAPLALEMAAVAAAIAAIAASAGTSADGINFLRESSSGMVTAMGKLVLAFVPVAAAIAPFAVEVAATAAAALALSAALAATGAALLLVGVGAVAVGAGFQLMTVTLAAFQMAAVTMGASAGMITQALLLVTAGAVPAAAAFLLLSPPMVAAAVGFGALALAAAAADLAFEPLALEMAAVAAAIAVIAASAGTSADGINFLRESSSGMVTAMGKLALAFAPAAAAIAPFAAAVTAADVATAAFLAVVTASAAGLALMAAGAAATGAGLQTSATSITAFKTEAATMGAATSQASAALSRFANSFAVVSGPMASFRTNAQATFTSLQTTVISSTTATVTQFVAGWRNGQTQVAAVWRSYQSTFAAAWNGVHLYAVNAARNTAQQIKAAFENMTITVPRPQLPHISVSYTTAGEGDAQVKVPNFSVSYYAAGGIMTDPTLFGMVGGEAGPEGIIPLDPFWNRLDSAVSAAVAENTGSLSLAKQDAAALSGMQSAVGGTDSRAKELYNEITSSSTTNQTNNNSKVNNRPNFTFSPQVMIQGNATAEDVHKGTTMSQADFNRYMDEYNWQNNRQAMNA